MGKDWISELLKRRQQSHGQAEQEAEMLRMAQSQIPEMFRRLVAQMQRDAQQYTQATGKVVRCALANTPGTCEIRYDSFPTFWMQLSVGSSDIAVIQTSKISSSAEQERKEFSILVIAKGQDQVYYRIEGKDYATESYVSEYLLSPLLERIG